MLESGVGKRIIVKKSDLTDGVIVFMICYFDCCNGVAGDMLVASLVDAGASWEELGRMLGELHLHGYRLELSDVSRAGIGAKYFKVHLEESHHHHHRHLGDILEMIRQARLPEEVKSRSEKVFLRLGEAEAAVHQCAIEKVHFHEVGAVDSIVDIVGSCICLHLLKVDRLYFSRIAVGSGQIKGSHGVLPVPAPATSRLLVGYEVFTGERTGELATPTGVAILTGLGSQKTGVPELKLSAVGYGAGTRDDAGHPNVVRAMLGESEEGMGETDEVSVIRFNVDDMTGEHLGWVAEQLMARGALDVGLIPMGMKKGRPGPLVEVLCVEEKTAELGKFILTQCTSFGVRVSREKRYKLGREFVEVEWPEGTVRVKVGYYQDQAVQISPEYEDCRKIAEKTGRNFREIYSQAAETARGMGRRL